jgi:sec-independent protein translocase protein TatA
MIFAKPWADALIVLLVVLLFFGPKRLPALGKSLGEGMREFKDSITGHSSSDDEERERLNEAAPAQPLAASAPPAEPASAPPAEPVASPGSDSPPVASSEHRS